MPVLMGEANPSPLRSATYEMDKLVEEVRERLCLKSREKLNAARRSTPYSRKACAFVDNPEHGEPPQTHHRFSQQRRDCLSSRRDVYSRSSWKMSAKCKCDRSSSDLSEAPDLLKQLLAEHRLIQEAVRRIHMFEHQCSEPASADVEQSSTPSSVRSISTDSVDSTSFSSTSDL